MGSSLAFVCAMPLELAAVRTATGLRPVGARRSGIHRGTVGGYPALAIAAGMGPVLAAAATERLLDDEPVRHVLVVGIAGAIDDSTAIGTVIRPEFVVDASTGRPFRPSVPPGGPVRGTLWTTDSITPHAEYPALRARAVIALDMETAAIGAACHRRGVPWSVYRAISDDPSDEVDEELFAMSNPDGSPNPRRVASYVVRHPGRIPHLARMGRNSQLAARRAAEAAVAAVPWAGRAA